MGIRGNFFKEDKSIADYTKKKVRKIFLDNAVKKVFRKNRYGFKFNTKGL